MDLRGNSFEEIAKWPKPNFVNPPLYGTFLPWFEPLLLGLSAAFVVLRLFSRGLLFKSFGIDDWMVIPAFLFAVFNTISHMKTLDHGWGRHIYDVDWRYTDKMLFWGWSARWAFGFTVMFTKVSILCFYLRFARKPIFRRLIHLTLVTLILWSIALCIVMVAECQPVAGGWDMFVRAKCISRQSIRAVGLAQGALNLLYDIILFCLPLKTVWELKRPKRERGLLILIFALGLLACIFAALRLKSMHKTFGGDVTWYGYRLWLWTSLEVHIGIIIACLPAVKPVLVITLARFGMISKSENNTSPEIHFGNQDGDYDNEDASSKTSIMGVPAAHLKSSRKISVRGVTIRSLKTYNDDKDFGRIGRKHHKKSAKSGGVMISLSNMSVISNDDEIEVNEIIVEVEGLGWPHIYKDTDIMVTHEFISIEMVDTSKPGKAHITNLFHAPKLDFDEAPRLYYDNHWDK